MKKKFSFYPLLIKAKVKSLTQEAPQEEYTEITFFVQAILLSKKFRILFSLVTFFPTLIYSENYLEQIEKADRRYNFAEMYLGIDSLYFPQIARTYENNEKRVTRDGFFPRIAIGATHFWGNADFYVSFSFLENADVRAAIETGFHYYPWKIKDNAFRPFVGISWMPADLKQNFNDGTEGIEKDVHLFPLIVGVSYQNDSFGQIDVSFRYYLNNEFEYNASSSQKETYQILPYSFALGYKYLFDVTTQNIKVLSKIKDKRELLKKNKKLSGIALGIGPSSAITLREFETDIERIAFLNETIPLTGLVPEISLGYHFYPIDSSINISYRYIFQRQEGFGSEQLFTRHAVGFEFIKFLFDYHGFVPFVGTGVEYNYLSYRETSLQDNIDINENKLGIPIVLGWDIRPYRSISWILRTTLRYNPLLEIETARRKVPFDHFEFNFIQFVFYPNRI